MTIDLQEEMRKERKRESTRQWTTNPENRTRNKDSCKQYRLKHRREILYARKRLSRELKEERREIRQLTLQLLGGKCVRCGYQGPALQIDHVKDDGAKERKGHKATWGRKGITFVIFEKIRLGSKDYQLLCANCNWEKRFEKEERERVKSDE